VEGVMSRDREYENQRFYRQRARLVKHAQQLARSGQHATHATIMPLLEHMEGFEAARDWLEARAMRLQLDRLCAASRGQNIPKVDFAAMRKSAEAKAVRRDRRSI
jgi:hypothetical protein